MTPLEVNKKIAEAKDLYIDGTAKTSTPNAIIIGNVSLLVSQEVNWAENIQDAFELFEEMPSPLIRSHKDLLFNGEQLKAIENSYNCHVKLYGCASQEAGLIYMADTAPMAICLAWLKWKDES